MIFSKLYNTVLHWARHRHASYYLGSLSFAESSFFPIPPDVMLAPMVLANPGRAWWYATLTTVTSVLGGIFGYFIGYFAFEAVQPWIEQFGYMAHFKIAQTWFEQWGFWVILVAGFSPVPYKMFTIAAGTMSLLFPVFVVASLIGRGLRFFIVAGLAQWGGIYLEKHVHQYIEWLGWLSVLLIVIAVLIWQ